MIFNCIEYITRELKQQKGKLKKYKKELAVLPKGGLMISKENKGTKYYSKYDMFRGKQRTKYLGSAENSEVQQLQKRYFLEKSIEAMENNIPLMENFLKNYKRIDPNYMQEHFPKAYQALPQSCFDAAGALDIEKWGSADFVRSTKYKENLTQTTAKGEHVRTKSEMNIANMLKSRGCSIGMSR